MLHLRLRALDDLRHARIPATKNETNSESQLANLFGEDTFGDKELQERLPPNAYKSFKKALSHGEPLDPAVADQIATAMKEWAIRKGATHFAHWFQPWTGLTAEKHDSFISFSGPTWNRTTYLRLDGKQLIKGEPDASSFPSGGLRSTFEARGYTAWDMASPSFLKKGPGGATLLIPTAFASWTGESLDHKTPLLKSNVALSQSVVRLMHLLGDKDVTSAHANLGVEQEFFVVDRGFYLARPDLVACGRTLLGALPAKGQQMEDHYFGTLPSRILAFLQDAEFKLWKLGVPVTTRHNEVAPSQYEMAPIFEQDNVACDHNMLMMEVLKETALEHGLVCLLHEKPFDGVNGSGKHNNWSVSTNTGENLMDPGKTPEKNIKFMLMLAALVRAISLNGDVLRSAIAVPGNDHRLGMNEAPPAIMSTYIGDQLLRVVEALVSEAPSEQQAQLSRSFMSFPVNAIPNIPRDSSDRNRTSPFAFAGNKFEFRAVGSSQNCARPAMILNSLAADSLNALSDEMEKRLKAQPSANPDTIAREIVKETLKQHQRAIFNGNGYSNEWRALAKKRGLPNLPTTPEAANVLSDAKNVALFEKLGVLTAKEIHSMTHVALENFLKHVAIEADCVHSMGSSYVLPTALEYKQRLTATLSANDPVQAEMLNSYNAQISALISSLKVLEAARKKAKEFDEDKLFEQSMYYRKEVMDAMLDVRRACDALEQVVDDKLWPFPKYSEILLLK